MCVCAGDSPFHPCADLCRSVCPRYYLDDDGQQQGPFSHERIRKWYTKGHLSPDLRVSCGGRGGPFVAIRDTTTVLEHAFQLPLQPLRDQLQGVRHRLLSVLRGGGGQGGPPAIS